MPVLWISYLCFSFLDAFGGLGEGHRLLTSDDLEDEQINSLYVKSQRWKCLLLAFS